MANDPFPPVDIIDIVPLIARRRRLTCKHDHVEVGDPEPTLECLDCGSPLCPWHYIRGLADNQLRWQKWNEEHRADADRKIAAHNAWVVKANATIQRLNDEIQHLHKIKNDLYNERVGDRLLGNIAKRPRRRK